MRFAKLVYVGAGIWGLAVLLPLLALVDVTGRHYAPPTNYPQFFYGFVAVALAWQVAFLVIGSDPARFRALMVPSIIEKMGWVVTLIALYATGHISALDAQASVPDFVLGMLFIMAFIKTHAQRQ